MQADRLTHHLLLAHHIRRPPELPLELVAREADGGASGRPGLLTEAHAHLGYENVIILSESERNSSEFWIEVNRDVKLSTIFIKI